MENTEEKSMVERVIELCKKKKIPVSRLEKDLDFGNGYLNPKKIKEIKTVRLIKILDYLEVSPEEFWDIGSSKTQETQTLLLRLKHINPELYESIMSDGDKNPALAKEDGLTETQRYLLSIIPFMVNSDISILASTAKALLDSHKSRDDS